MLYRWMLALHVCGILLWFAGVLITLHVLKVHERKVAAGGSTPEDFARLEGSAGRIMDAGATVALVAGLWMLFENLGLLRGAGFMHAKLTLVLVASGFHGYLRVQLKRFRTGKSHHLAGWVYPAVVATFFSIVVLIIARPF